MLYYGCWKHKKFRFRIKTFSFRDIWQHLYHDKCKCLTLPSAVFRWVGESALGHTLLRSRYPRVSVIMTYLFSLSILCKNLNRSWPRWCQADNGPVWWCMVWWALTVQLTPGEPRPSQWRWGDITSYLTKPCVTIIVTSAEHWTIQITSSFPLN